VLVSLLEDGVPEIRLINRTKKRAERLANDISDDRICIHDWDDRADALKNAALLVNVTTLGMTGQRPLELSLENLPVNACVYDIVYSPLETNLLEKSSYTGE
jgi:shikimate dehydrogenase